MNTNLILLIIWTVIGSFILWFSSWIDKATNGTGKVRIYPDMPMSLSIFASFCLVNLIMIGPAGWAILAFWPFYSIYKYFIARVAQR